MLTIGIASVLLGLALLAALDAPRELLALVVAMLVGLVAALAVTLVRKISIHTAVAAGAVVILALVVSPTLLALFILVALIGRARVAVGGPHRSAGRRGRGPRRRSRRKRLPAAAVVKVQQHRPSTWTVPPAETPLRERWRLRT